MIETIDTESKISAGCTDSVVYTIRSVTVSPGESFDASKTDRVETEVLLILRIVLYKQINKFIKTADVGKHLIKLGARQNLHANIQR
jgi:hypothetical protein